MLAQLSKPIELLGDTDVPDKKRVSVAHRLLIYIHRGVLSNAWVEKFLGDQREKEDRSRCSMDEQCPYQ